MKILFLTPYPLQVAPSQRFRFEQYFSVLQAKGYHLAHSSFLKSHNWQIFYKSGNFLGKILALLSGFGGRIIDVFRAMSAGYVFIHREVTPIGPPVFEWVIAKILRKKIIYDFDDAIWLTDKTNESKLEKCMRWRSKVKSICKWSYKISVGNAYLASFALQYNKNVYINPTTLDTRLHQPLPKIENDKHRVTIGWTGSRSTLKYLKEIEPVLVALENTLPQVSFLVIADEKPDLNVARLQFLPWSKQTEIEDLNLMDIGIMPLPNDPWTQGKCGFKALQYFALRKPAVVSPVAINKDIVIPNVNGFWANSQQEWIDALTTLVTNKELREELGAKGLETIRKKFSVDANEENFLRFFA
ncbi:MAG: glycosyltransferase family 4 protein [Chryseotalea sp.]